MQYIISIGLVIGTLTIYAQLRLTQKKGECYRNLIEIGSWKGGKLDVNTFAAELKNRPEIVSVTRAGGSILFAWLQQIVIKNRDGSESYYSLVQYLGKKISFKPWSCKSFKDCLPGKRCGNTAGRSTSTGDMRTS